MWDRNIRRSSFMFGYTLQATDSFFLIMTHLVFVLSYIKNASFSAPEHFRRCKHDTLNWWCLHLEFPLFLLLSVCTTQLFFRNRFKIKPVERSIGFAGMFWEKSLRNEPFVIASRSSHTLPKSPSINTFRSMRRLFKTQYVGKVKKIIRWTMSCVAR